MRPLIAISVRHSVRVLAICAIITAALATQIPRVRLELDGRSLVPAGDPSLTASDRAARLFDLQACVLVGVAAPQGTVYSPEVLRQIVRLSRELAEVPGIVRGSVTSLATVPLLSISSGELDYRPLSAMGTIQAAAEKLRRIGQTAGLESGILVARDRKAAGIYADVEPSADRYVLLRRVREIAARDPGPGRIYLTGTALAQAVLGTAAGRDLAALVPAVLVVLACVLFAFFRRIRPALYSILEIGISLVCTAGIMGLTGQSVFVTTLVLPVILITVGLADDVYAMRHYFLDSRRCTGAASSIVVSSFEAVAPQVQLTGILTIVGLLSFAITDLEPMRIFGIFGALAVMFSTLCTFTLLPALMSRWPPRSFAVSKPRPSRWRFERLLGVYEKLGPKRILAAAVLLTVLAALEARHLRVDDSWIGNLPSSSDIAQGDSAMNRLFGGVTPLEFQMEAGPGEDLLDPRALTRLGQWETALSAAPGVGAVHSFYSDVLRITAALREAPSESLRGRTLTPGEIEQAHLLLSSAAGYRLGRWLDTARRRARLTVLIQSADYERIGHILRTSLPGSAATAESALTPFGDGWISYTTVRLLVEGQRASLTLAFVSDLLVLSLLFRSWRAGLIALLPVGSSIVAMYAALALARVPLGIANSLFAAVAIGIGTDFAVHLMASFREHAAKGDPAAALRAAVGITGPAIMTSASALIAGFAVLLLSQVAPNAQLGAIIDLNLGLCAGAAVVLLPALLLVLYAPKRENEGTHRFIRKSGGYPKRRSPARRARL